MISEYDKIHNERGERIVISDSPDKLKLENDIYIMDPKFGNTTCFIVYAENPLPARICIEDISRRFFTCIGIFEPVYYLHDIYQNTFTKDQKMALNNLLSKKYELDNCTPWSYIVDSWKIIMSENNLEVQEYSKTQPDYTLLPDIHREY